MQKSKWRTRALLAIFLGLFVWWGCQYWSSYVLFSGGCSDEPPEWFDSLVTLARDQGYPGFQLSVIDENGSRVDCAAGQSLQGLRFQRMQPEFPIFYASLTKVFTSIVSHQLISEGHVKSEDYLVDYLREDLQIEDARVRRIKIGHLLRHTAGFDRSIKPDPMMQPEPWCPNKIEGLGNQELDYEPGTYYSYSNLGYCLLGGVIEAIEGKPIQDVFQDRLFAPLELTSIQVGSKELIFEGSVGYGFSGRENLHDLISVPFGSMLAVGSWAGTAGDFMTLLSAAFFSEDILDDKSRKELLSIDDHCDNSRWRVCHGDAFYAYRQSSSGPTFYWRDGSLPGVTSFAGLGDNGVRLVFLANSRPNDWIRANDQLGLFFYRRLFNN